MSVWISYVAKNIYRGFVVEVENDLAVKLITSPNAPYYYSE